MVMFGEMTEWDDCGEMESFMDREVGWSRREEEGRRNKIKRLFRMDDDDGVYIFWFAFLFFQQRNEVRSV
jgi:hypothetical protein